MEKLKTLHEESQKELTTYAWVDKNKGVAESRSIARWKSQLPTWRKKSQRQRSIAAPAAPAAPAGASPAPTASQQPGAAQPAHPSAPPGSPTDKAPRRSSSNSTFTTGTRFTRTSHYAMNTEYFDRAS